MSELLFEPVRLEDTGRIYRYTSVYGEGSCQHSPVSMYSLWEKYEDCVCEGDGFLYTLRRRLCDETYRVYLAPLGGARRPRANPLQREVVESDCLTCHRGNCCHDSYPNE